MKTAILTYPTDTIRTKLALLFLVMFLGYSVFGQVTTVKSGSWNDASTWSNNSVPTATTNVQITHGDRITIDASATCADLHVDNGARLNVNAALVAGDLVADDNGAQICLNAPLTVCTMFLDNGFRLYAGCSDITITNCNNAASPVTIRNGAHWFGNTDCDNDACTGGMNLTVTGDVTITECDITYNNLTITGGKLNLAACNVAVNGTLTLNAGADLLTTGTLTYGANAKLVFNRSYILTGNSKIWGTGLTASNVPAVVEVQSGVITTNDTLYIKRRINLLGGMLGSVLGTKIKLAPNDTIFKCGGSFASTPRFASGVTMLYCAPKPGNPPTVLGAEMPETGFTGNVIISTNLILGANIKAPSGRVIVTSTGILNDSNFKVEQATAIQVQSGGVVRTQKPNGLTGDSSLFGSLTLTLGAGTTVEYYASSGTQKISPRTDYGNIIFSDTATKNFPPNSTTTIVGDVTNTGSGSITCSNASTVNFSGADQNITGVAYYDVLFGGSGNKTLTSSSSVSSSINIAANTDVKLYTNNYLTLISSAASTAQVGPLTGGADIIGNVCWQRFIPGGPKNRRWRFLSNPIRNVTFEWWQNDIHITGPGANGVACQYNTTSNSSMVKNSNGFDQNHTGLSNPTDTQAYSTIFTYNEPLGGWKTISSTRDTINPLKAYRTFVRGNRNVEGCMLLTLMPNSVSDVTIQSCGPIVKYTQTVPLSFTAGKGNGWNYVSNPYPSSINWWNAAWVTSRSTAISPTIYIWDPINAQYTSWNPLVGGINGGCRIIGTGQSFFVQTSAATNLTFEETYKVDSGQMGFFGKADEIVQQNKLMISLQAGSVTDQAIVYMHASATSGFDQIYDGFKMGFAANSVAIASNSNNDLFAFAGIAPTQTTDTFKISCGFSSSSATYTFNFNGIASFDSKYILLLRDKFTNTLTNLNATSTYTFITIGGVPASLNQKRFEIIIQNASSLPVTLTDFSARANADKTVTLHWQTAQEVNNSHFIVQHSTNGSDFHEIALVKGNGTVSETKSYTAFHMEPVSGANYYRLVQVDGNGKTSESYTIVLSFNTKGAVQSQIQMYPVPAKDVLTVRADEGVTVTEVKTFDFTGRAANAAISISANKATLGTGTLCPGTYFISVTLSDGTVQRTKIIKE